MWGWSLLILVDTGIYKVEIIISNIQNDYTILFFYKR